MQGRIGPGSHSSNAESLRDPAIPLRFTLQRTESRDSKENLDTNVCCGTGHNSAEVGMTPGSVGGRVEEPNVAESVMLGYNKKYTLGLCF